MAFTTQGTISCRRFPRTVGFYQRSQREAGGRLARSRGVIQTSCRIDLHPDRIHSWQSRSAISAGSHSYGPVRITCRAVKINSSEDEVSDEERREMDLEAAAMAEEFLASLSQGGGDGYFDEDEDEEDLGAQGNPFASAAAEDEDEEEEAPQAAAPKRGGVKRLRQKKWLSQLPIHLLPKIAIIGRPNVGKSALFNRLSGTQGAIVYDTPGVTRDRLYVRGFWGADEFLLIDTGGLIKPSHMSRTTLDLPEHDMDPGTEASAELIPGLIERQAAAGVEEADAVIVVTDGQAGPCASDEDIIQWLRKTYPAKPVILAVNKCESPTQGAIQVSSFWEYGHEPLGISALTGTGTGELMDQLMAVLPRKELSTTEVVSQGGAEEEEDSIKVAILGRPNVGKSSLLNAIVGEDRTIVSKMSGTTRDSIDTEFTDATGQKFTLVDTAGIRRRASVASRGDGAEQLSVKTALKAVARADVAVLVLDAQMGPTEQDFRLAERIGMDGRACVLVLNKWDLVPDKETNTMVQYQKNLAMRLRNIHWAPTCFISATQGQRVSDVLKTVKEVAMEHRRRVSTATLNLVLTDAVIVRAPPVVSGKRGRIYYGTQAATRPPTFVMFVNETKMFSDQYRRFIERQLREQIGFHGTPVRTLWRGKVGRSKSQWVQGGEKGASNQALRKLRVEE